MSKSPLVSVLITVFNREKYVAETITSILASRFSDFEIVIVDDQSSDNSRDIVRSFLSQDSRIRFFENDANLGDYGNRMKAASLAIGTYLKYLDSDDLIYKHSLDVMVDAMEQYPDCALGISHSAAEDTQPYPWRLTPKEVFEKHFLKRGCIGCGPSGAIIRKDAFLQEGGFNKSWGVLSDTELWLRLASKSPIALLPPGLVWWRRHEGQEFSKGNAKETYLHLGHKLNMESLSASHCPLDDELRQRAVARCKQHHARKLLSLAIRNFQFRQTWNLFRDSQLTLLDLLGGIRKYQ